MCGITGFWNGGISQDSGLSILQRMTDVIRHRGPDGDGAWFDQQAGLALGHRRLSIIDLSNAGSQPMTSHSGRYVLVYNGEIYNHRALRSELVEVDPSIEWRGHSDTEVVLAAFDRWGITQTLERLNGMFAFALWDCHRQVLTLARDRMGEKPLYYSRMGQTFLFGSELKSLKAHPNFTAQIDKRALTSFFRFNYIPAPLSIWQDVLKLPAACYVEVSEAGRKISEPQLYWSFRDAAVRGVSDPLPEGTELADQIEALLKDAVGLRMEADVPLGAFLSGGVDSSTIAALMQVQSSRPIKTYTIGSDNPQYNEAEHARAVADHLGTDHTSIYISGDDAMAKIPQLPFIWDEPFADSSQIPTLLVSELARRHVTVSLTGDGGDELFGGYNRYITGMKLWNFGAKLPSPVRRALAHALQDPALAKGSVALMKLLPTRHRVLNLAGRLPKIGQILDQHTPDAVYSRLIAQCDDPAAFVIDGVDSSVGNNVSPAFVDFRQQMIYRDTTTYLSDDILVKLDRAAMAVSLEGRVPFLDHRLVELAWRVPMSAKIKGGTGKHILRHILYRHVPRELIERPKMGFAVPVGDWLKGPLREWAESLLNAPRLQKEGLLNVGKVRSVWENHLAGTEINVPNLWALLMFQAWLDSQGRVHAGVLVRPNAHERSPERNA